MNIKKHKTIMNKHIWYISKYANILKYGANSRQFSFCKEFNDNGYNSTLILGNSSHLFPDLPKFKGKFKKDIYMGVNIIWINLPEYSKATSLLRFWSWVLFEYRILKLHNKFNIEKPDIVIASSLSILSVLSGAYFKWKYRSKFIFEVRDIWPLTLIDLKGISKQHPISLVLGIIEKVGYKYSDSIVGTMPGLSEHVVNTINVNETKVINIPQGVDLDFYENNQMNLSESFIDKYFLDGKFTITYAGTLGVSYALDKVISAAVILEKKMPNVHFLFLGNGIEKEKLMIQAKGLTNVTFVPRIRKEEVLDFLSNSSLLLHSFKMKKVFEYGISPNKLIDYMFSARPIIIMFSGYQSIINDANCGEFIPSEDVNSLILAIEKYSNFSKEDLDKIGNNGKEYLINNLTYNNLVHKYINLFD